MEALWPALTVWRTRKGARQPHEVKFHSRQSSPNRVANNGQDRKLMEGCRGAAWSMLWMQGRGVGGSS